MHAVVVLAAGGSRRLGVPKQLLTRAGETLVHRTVRLARDTAPQRLLVIAGAHADAVAAAVADLGAEVMVNPQWEAGLSTSLQCAADALREHSGPVLILGCDQPALELEHLLRLLDAASRATSLCAATRHDDRLGPPAVIPAALLQQAAALSGDHGFGAQLNRLPSAAIGALLSPELELDIDTGEDRKAAIGLGLLDPAASK